MAEARRGGGGGGGREAGGETSYQYRTGLRFVSAEPEFIRKITTAREGEERAREEERAQRRRPSNGEEPVLVDSQGNVMPEDAQRGDCAFDRAAADAPASDELEEDAAPIEAHAARDGEAPPRAANPKRARLASRPEDLRKLAKLKSNVRLLSFGQDD